jgi:uncharacterized membrane protein YccC
MKDMLAANQHYLQKLADILAGKKVHTEDYKLARKQVYVSSANLSAAFQRMISEPKSKQRKTKEVNKFIVLNHILSSFIATVASNLLHTKRQVYPSELQRPIKRAAAILSENHKKPEPASAGTQSATILSGPEKSNELLPDLDEELLRSQLEFILKISTDIRKNSDTILAQLNPASSEKA